MDEKKVENIQALTHLLVVITFFVLAYGFAYQRQYIMLAGLLILGISLVVHAPLSILTITRWQKDNAKTKLAFWGEGFFAFGQFFFGVFAIFGFFADVATNYLTSGRFWKAVSHYPFLFLFSFGLFMNLLGISQIVANLQPEGNRFVDKLGSFKEIFQGVAFLLFGLFLMGLVVFVKS